jgi:L-arabonate dehydrase
MVRISDARMSGTAYGTVVLHVCPEAAVGGNLAVVHNGDVIALDVEARSIQVEVSQAELDQRLKSWQPPALTMKGGYQQLYVERVMQANTGADLDFLVGCRGDEIPRESH